MAKPIAVIYVPIDSDAGNGNRLNPFELAHGLNGQSTKYDMPRELYGDYLWFCFPKDIETFELQVFHPKDFTDIQYEELKQMVEDAIEKTKNHFSTLS